MVTLAKQMFAFDQLSLDLDSYCGNYTSAYVSLGSFASLYSIDLEQVKEDLLKVSDIQGSAKEIQDKPSQEIDLIVLHNAYSHLTALSGCIYTKPEDFDPVHTLACINDCLAFILVMQELYDC
ncbi:hypothetical protein Stuart_20 [Providencia phage vB_PstP_PS3]|uniref:Uncharacterized protein n=1 Tax=Providencia phage vB_PstP_PS3 TaxID=2848038 RepID=A0A411AWC9_9CAUD|nr:hypothetical protein HOV05_gp20 [Providencia phage vB_PstP_PS3]QAX92411.1 hypothetical protein Stuart_20 [Providencia phage vB_PstP_PS3]